MEVEKDKQAAVREVEKDCPVPHSQFATKGLVTDAPEMDALFRAQKITDQETLRQFLCSWLETNIVRMDLPVIRWARECASRNDSQALIELDRCIASLPLPQELRAASLAVGRHRLRELAPLKGHRFLGRYRVAVESDQAPGHNAVVYGIHLFLFSIPLREGLLSYAYQTLHGFHAAASRSVRLVETQKPVSIEEICVHLPRQVEASLSIERETIFGPIPACEVSSARVEAPSPISSS